MPSSTIPTTAIALNPHCHRSNNFSSLKMVQPTIAGTIASAAKSIGATAVAGARVSAQVPDGETRHDADCVHEDHGIVLDVEVHCLLLATVPPVPKERNYHDGERASVPAEEKLEDWQLAVGAVALHEHCDAPQHAIDDHLAVEHTRLCNFLLASCHQNRIPATKHRIKPVMPYPLR